MQEILQHEYINQMEYIKRRIEFMDTIATTAHMHGFPLIVTTECIYLQLRQILELIAMGSLAANRDAIDKARRTLGKMWRLKDVLGAVEKINPHGYPHPITEVPSTVPEVKNDFIDKVDGFLSRDRFRELYGKCGDILHARNPFGGTRDYQAAWDEWTHWRDQIIGLLNYHKVKMVDDEGLWVVHMQNAIDGKVHLYRFERLPPEQCTLG